MKCTNCNVINDEQTLECESCGSTFVTPELCQEEILGKAKVTLVSMTDRTQRIEIPEDGVIIERGSELDPIFNSMKVSEIHCEITVDGSECYVEDIGSTGIGSTNGTTLNGDKLAPGKRITFGNGDKLLIAHLLFEIEIEYPQKAEVMTKESDEDIKEVWKWVIKCPVSQRKIDVDDSDARIDICDCCADRKDRKQISEEKAVRVRA